MIVSSEKASTFFSTSKRKVILTRILIKDNPECIIVALPGLTPHGTEIYQLLDGKSNPEGPGTFCPFVNSDE